MEKLNSVEMAEEQQTPYVEIVEQPAGKALRFRYECEGRSAGSIPGVNGTPKNKTFPTVRVVGYKGRALIVVSCVTKDPPYRPHPHNLVGKGTCKKGVCTMEVPHNMTISFNNLGIQCVKKKDTEESLKVREEIRVDPFRTGFDHKWQPNSIDLNSVRLCFQVFIEGREKGKFNVPLPPVVSNPIYDKKTTSDLVICKLSHYSAPACGGMEMILLCEKVTKDDIQIKFFEEKDGQIVWEDFADFLPRDVHKQTAISFKTPRYPMAQRTQPVQVYVQLMRPSDIATSEAVSFQMLPQRSGGTMRDQGKWNDLNIRRPESAWRARTYISAVNDASCSPVYEENGQVSPSSDTVAEGDNLYLYPVEKKISSRPPQQTNIQVLRPEASPVETPSPVQYVYHPNAMQLHLPCEYHQTIVQQALLSPEAEEQCQYIINQGLHAHQQPINIGDTDITDLNMVHQKCHFDENYIQLDSAELVALGTELADNLSSILSF